MPSHYGSVLSRLAAENNFGAGVDVGGASGGAGRQQQPQQSSVLNSVGNLLNNPFLMNLLAQQGFSTMPQSRLGAVGRAGIATAQQERQSGLDELQKRFIESQIGVNRAKLEAGAGGNRIVQSAQTLANGNVGFLNAFTGEVVDTGAKAGGKGQVIDMPGIGQVIYDPIQATLTQVNPEDVIRTASAERAGAKEAAIQDAEIAAIRSRVQTQELAKNLTTVPEKVAASQSFLDEGKAFIRRLETGELQTGPIRGQLPAFTTNEQLFEAYSGAQILEQISSVTLGALSKGEMDFLKTTVSGRTKTEEANIDIIQRKIDIIESANKRALAKIGQSKSFDVSTMTDAELEAIASGR